MQQQTQGQSSQMNVFDMLVLARWLKKPTPKNEQAGIKALEGMGIDDARIATIKVVVEEGHKIIQKRKDEESHDSDKLFVAGIGAIDLILLQILASVANRDVAASLCWLALVISLPCAAIFFYISSWRERKKYTAYSRLHERLALLSVLFGAVASISLVWHFWFIASILLITVLIAGFIAASIYKLFTDEDVINYFNSINAEINKGV